MDESSDAGGALARRVARAMRSPADAALDEAWAALDAPERATAPGLALHAERLRRAGDARGAIEGFGHALARDPAFAPARHARALALAASGDRLGARADWAGLLERDPDDAAARRGYARSFVAGEADRERAAVRARLEGDAGDAGAWRALARIEDVAGDARAAALAWDRAVALASGDAAGWRACASARRRAGDVDGAIAARERALALAPDHPETLAALARDRGERADLPAAIAALERALALAPARADWFRMLGAQRQQLASHPGALAAFARARELEPGHAAGHSALLIELQHDASLATADALALEHRRYGREHAAGGTRPARGRPRTPGGALRIGFVSPRFASGPLASLLLPVLERLDPARHTILLFASHEHDDAAARRFRALASHREALPRDDREAAARIAAARPDLLVDLAGHTPGNRLPLFALGPAPVQASWLDYADTTGVPAIDYLLTDRVHMPAADAPRASERPVWLPVRFAHRPLAAARASPSPRRRRGAPTFGSFNRHAKLNDAVLDLWRDLLAAEPDARLVLQASAYGSASTRAWLLARWRERGLPVERIELRGYAPLGATLAAYADVDVALDPFPWNGGVTTADALACGIPVVTLAGDRPLARQSAALLAAVGRPGWIASTPGAYLRIARELAHDTDADATRASLAADYPASPLGDVDAFAAALGRAFDAMVDAGPLAADDPLRDRPLALDAGGLVAPAAAR